MKMMAVVRGDLVWHRFSHLPFAFNDLSRRMTYKIPRMPREATKLTWARSIAPLTFSCKAPTPHPATNADRHWDSRARAEGIDKWLIV